MNQIYTPIKPQRISEEIVKQFKALIFNGKLKPGQQLPPERELAKLLQVSRVTLREALNSLQGMGLIEIQQGNRTYVRPITTRSIYDPLLSYIKKSPSNILEVYEVRKFLEIGLVKLAAERATNDEIEKLEKILQVMKEDFEQDRLGAKADFDFHTIIAESSKNFVFAHIMNTIYDLLQETLRFAWADQYQSKERQRKSLQIHEDIFAAIKRHDCQRAEKKISEHMNFIEKHWRKALLKKK